MITYTPNMLIQAAELSIHPPGAGIPSAHAQRANDRGDRRVLSRQPRPWRMGVGN
jgi:hypothetical protein